MKRKESVRNFQLPSDIHVSMNFPFFLVHIELLRQMVRVSSVNCMEKCLEVRSVDTPEYMAKNPKRKNRKKVSAFFSATANKEKKAQSVPKRKKKREKFLKTPADIFCMEDQSFRIMREKHQCQLRFLGMSRIFHHSVGSGKELADYFREGVRIESAFLHTDHRGQDSVQISD